MENENNEENSTFKYVLKSTIVLIVVLTLLFCLYLTVLKSKEKSKESGESTPTPSPINTPIEKSDDDYDDFEYDIPISNTDSDEIEIAKTKLKEASNFFDPLASMKDKEVYSELYYYFDTLENFNRKFYSIYSKELSYKDVFIEYKLPSGEYSTNVSDADLIYGYVIKDNKVYQNDCNIGTGDYERMDNFTVESKTDDTIKVNYKLIYKDQLVDGDEYENGDAQIVLVRENNEWKILSATIVGMCNSTYKIGK